MKAKSLSPFVLQMAEKAKAVLDKVKESRGADPSKGAASNGIVENSLDTKKLDDII